MKRDLVAPMLREIVSKGSEDALGDVPTGAGTAADQTGRGVSLGKCHNEGRRSLARCGGGWRPTSGEAISRVAGVSSQPLDGLGFSDIQDTNLIRSNRSNRAPHRDIGPGNIAPQNARDLQPPARLGALDPCHAIPVERPPFPAPSFHAWHTTGSTNWFIARISAKRRA